MSDSSFKQRIGWEPYLKPFLFKKLPAGTGWSATLGTICALLFGLMVFTGMFLAVYYNPSPDKAYQSIDFIMNDVPLGALLRGLHHWGAGAMVLVAAVHLLTSFFSGSYKAPRELTWTIGVCLLLVTLGLGFTGYLLPWDMKSYWATVVSSNIPREIPVVGDIVTRVMLGGADVSGLTLTRFYSIHSLILPWLLAGLTLAHIYLVRIHGLTDHSRENPAEEPAAPPYRFFPEHMLRSAVVFTAVLIILSALSIFEGVPREQIAGTLIEDYLPRPEWYYMWLFQLLTYFSGVWETVGSLAIPIAGVAVLFALPFLNKGTLHGAANRPLCAASGITAIICILYLSLLGFAGAKPYGETITLPDKTLTQTASRGLFLFADRDCAYCHQIQGRGGHRTGPDLANIKKKGRTADYLEKFLKDPQAVSSTSIMPKYDLPKDDLKALAEFTLFLDFSGSGMQVKKRDDVLKHPISLQ